MNAAIYGCPTAWEAWLPAGTRRLQSAEELAEQVWPLLALTPSGCKSAGRGRCRILLAAGDCRCALEEIEAETVVSYGLSPRDSLTLSSLRSPVLCVQRALPRLDGTVIDPQEFPLPPLPGPAEELLPLLGLRLLQMPLTRGLYL